MFTRNRTANAIATSHGNGNTSSLLRLGRTASSHPDWISQAIQELRNPQRVQRIGVWLQDPQCGEPMDAGPVIFHGEVWEEEIGSGPQEWARLSADTPLPAQLLDGGESCEYQLDGPNCGPIFGPMADLGRVLWVPVTTQRTLRGLVMLGTRQKQAPITRERAEMVAEQLGLLLELEDTRRLAAARKADLELWRRMHGLTSEGQSANIILGQLAESCTRGDSVGGLGGVFALIGERKSGLPVAAPSSAVGGEQLVIRAQSGEAHWASRVNEGPLESIWRHAVAEQRAISVEADRLPHAKEILRVVAIPVGRGDASRGVLLAGLPGRVATLESLERLELRAMLAEAVLEREQRTEAMAREEQRHQALLESAEKPIVLVDRQGIVRGMSRGARELLPRERAVAETNSGSLCFAEFFRLRHWERVQTWLESGGHAKPHQREETLESELAAGPHVLLTRLPLAGRDFSAVGLEKIRDKKDPCKIEDGMLRAEKLASLGQRVTAIVHELSNPLTTIVGNAQRLILRQEAGAPHSEAHRILEEAERATTILRQLSYTSRDAQPERRLVSLNEVVERAVDLQREMLAGSSLQLNVDTGERLPPVLGDFTQLQQVLLNLLQNAQQAIEQNGQGTTIGVRTSSAGPGRVRLEVWDDGPGIPGDLQARIFDPFFTTKPEGLGTGLGLAIVNGFVHQHRGSISVHCPPQGGTRFVVELPAAEELQEPENPPIEKNASASLALPVRSSGHAHGAAAAQDRAPHILVVEDEATVANLIADVLRDEGMNVDVLLDGASAWEAAQKASYDLAICDLKMPGMDGQVFYGKLLQQHNPLREHVLFVTGDVVAQRTREFLLQNHLPHVAKPFRVEELWGAVRQMLCGGTWTASS